jgi:hypothetical protein
VLVPTDDLVTEDKRQLRLVELAVADVQIRAAHPAREDAQPYLPVPELRPRQLQLAER